MSQYEALKDQISILDLAPVIAGTQPIALNKSKGEYRLNPCPICGGHDHFTIYAKDNSFSSFSDCCKGGDVIAFIQQVKQVDFKEAIRILEEFAPAVATPEKRIRKASFSAPQENEIQVDLTELIHSLAKNETTYFKERGLSENIINEYKLGYHPQGLNGVSVKSLEMNLGLQQKASNVFYCYQYFLPVWNADGTCTYFISRKNDELSEEKGLNLNKTHNLKGFNVRIFNDRYLEKDFTQDKVIFVTEGIFDALSYETIGHKAIALNSVQNKNKFVELVKKNSDHLKNKIFILIADNDKAGQGMLSIVDELEALELTVHVGEIPIEYKDSNDYLKAEKSQFEQNTTKIIKQATSNNK
ncbi:toprim domain-containing protein, partial [Bacillus sp. UNCCL81]|uniref:toprim domain-containing protein n=1 Tax=Bacillus sp. UNCCL81 TaxID=1502755 RepID=UPI00158785AF